MFNNVKSKKRITQVIVAFMVICMTLTGSFLLLDDAISEVHAATVTVESVDQLKNAFNNIGAGDTLIQVKAGDYEIGGKLKAIPSGANVELALATGTTIRWDTEQSGTAAIMDTNYTDGIKNDYFGLITNNGKLNITGDGTIRMKKVNYDYKNSDDYDNWAVKSCAIYNTGELIIGGSIVVENYTAMVRTDKDGGTVPSQDMFVYSIGIYNEGKITTSGEIRSGAFAGGTVDYDNLFGSENNSWLVAFSHGIYGGEVITAGGDIDSTAYSGFFKGGSTATKGNKSYSIATGICAPNAVVLGDTDINTSTTQWRNNEGNNIWGSGSLTYQWSVGVMYPTTSYPVIGPAVDINSSFRHITNGDYNTSITVPGTTKTYNVGGDSGSSPSDYARRAYAVAGINKDLHAGLYGAQTAEVDVGSNCGNLFGPVATDAYGTSYSGIEQYMNAYTHGYYSEYAYRNGKSAESLTRLGSEEIFKQSGSNTDETKTSHIANGVSGTGGTQYMIMYRYYKGDTSNSQNLYKVSYTYDPAIMGENDRAVVKVGSTDIYTGVLSSVSNAVGYSKGGVPDNENYYELVSKSYEVVSPDTYVNRNIDTLKSWTAGNELSASGDAPNSSMMIIYMDYVLKNPTPIRVVASDNDINPGTTDVKFTVGYTGSAIRPGEDFNFGIIDLGDDIYNETNYKVVTGDYDISGKSTSNVRAVRYAYSTDGSNWVENALPKDVGNYSIRVTVTADTTYSPDSFNRAGTTSPVILTCTITPAEVTIKGEASKEVAYGSKFKDIIKFADYSAENKSKEPLNGSWTFANVNPDTYPTVGRHTVDLKWSPSDNGNYKDTTLRITVDVAKRDVTVSAGNSTVIYGNEGKFAVSYSTDLGPDASLAAGWLANSEFEVKYGDGTWGAYYPSLPAGNYDVRIKNFGGTGDANNNFIISDAAATLAVTKRDVYYTATATDKTYDGNSSVEITLTNPTNNYINDNFADPVVTKGTVVTNNDVPDINAGQNKKVVVDVDAAMSDTSLSAFANNYNLVISNAADLKVNVAKATPTGVSVAAAEDTRVYNSAQTLADVYLNPTATALAGNWNWVDSSITPTVAVSEYTAVFTPADTTNYTTLTQKVTLNVTKAIVYVTVEPKTITYGAGVPALTLVYNGFTGTDTLESVKPEGNALASTNYSINSDAGNYTITISSELEAANYEFVEQNSTITVNPKAVTVKPVDKTITYGEAVGTINVTETGFLTGHSLESIGATVSFLCDGYVPGATYGSVGEYNITVNVNTTNKNYAITCETGTLTVQQAVLTVKPDENVLKLEYGTARPAFAADKLYTITGFYGDDTAENAGITGTPVFNTDYNAGSPVGSYVVTVNVENVKAKNYRFVGAEGAITVIKTNPVVQTNPGVTVINSNKLSTAVFDNTAVVVNKHNNANVEGTFAFKMADEIPAWSLNEHTYTAVFTPRDTTNYNTVEVQISFNLQTKTISGTPVIQGSAMVGSTLTVNLDSMDPKTADSYTYQWYAGDVAIAGATSKDYVIDKAYEEKAINVKLVAIEDKGFKGDIASDYTSAVIAALLSTTADQFSVVLPEGAVYNALSHEAIVMIADNINADQIGDTITVKYNGSVNAPSAAGTYIVTVDINAPAEPANGYDKDYHYGPATGIVLGEFTIEQAPFYVSISAADREYDGTTNIYDSNVSVSGWVDPSHAVYVTQESVNFAFNTPDVGTDKTIVVSSVTLIGEDAPNYKPVVTTTTASITPKTLTVVPIATPKDYDKSNKIDITFSVSGYATGEGASSVYLTNGVGYTTDANAGKNKIVPADSIKYTVDGSKAHNYKIELAGDCFVEIRKINPDFTPLVIDNIDGQPIVYDANRNLSTISPNKYHSDDGTWTFADTTIVPTVPQRTYTAIYRPDDQTNYNDVESVITIIVEKKKVTLTAEDKSVVYGSKAPNYTVLKPVGFTGSDTLENCVGGSWLPDCNYFAGNNVGIYEIGVDVKGLSSDNYYFEGVSGNLIVSPATVNVSATAVNKIYDGSNEVTVNFKVESGIFENDDVYLASSSIKGAAATANAGTTTVGFADPALTGDLNKIGNYIVIVSPASGVLTVEIAKADIPGEFRFPSDVRVQYGFDLTYVTFGEPGIGDGTFAYENAKQIVPGKLGEHSTYKMIFTPTDSRNYNTKEAIIPLTVDKCILNYVVGVSGVPQSGQTLTVVTTGLPAKANEFIMYQWYRLDNGVATAIDGANDKSYVATDDDVGCTLYVMTYFDLSTAPYEFADSIELDSFEEGVTGILGKVNDTIQEIKLTFWQRLRDWIRRIIEILTTLQFSGILGG